MRLRARAYSHTPLQDVRSQKDATCASRSACISHETNTFCAGLTEIEHFQAREWRVGSDIIAAHRGVRDDLGGMIEAGERLGVELVPTFSATTEPSGTISRAAFERMRDELLAGLKAAGRLDAICLALHGAGVAEGARRSGR